MREECFSCNEWFNTPFVAPDYDENGNYTNINHQVYCAGCLARFRDKL